MPKRRTNLRLVQLSDPQLGFSDVLNRGRIAKDCGLPEESLPLQYSGIDEHCLQQAFTKLLTLDPAPDAVLVTGDMVHDWQDSEQWESYERILKKLKLPVYEAMGNHDGFCDDGLVHYAQELRKRDAYHVTINGLFLLVINSNYLKQPELLPLDAKAHRAFVEAALETHQDMPHKLIMLHHPLYFEQPEEEEEYFTLPPESRAWLLGLAERYHVKVILSGHYHRNHVTHYNGTTLITTGPTSEAMGTNHDGSPAMRGFRVLDWNLKTGDVDHEFVKL